MTATQKETTMQDKISTTREVMDWLLANERITLELYNDMATALNSAEKHDLEEE
jgi:hypothetical protein